MRQYISVKQKKKKKTVIQETKSQHGSSFQAITWVMFIDALLPKTSYMPKSQNQCGRGLRKGVYWEVWSMGVIKVKVYRQ